MRGVKAEPTSVARAKEWACEACIRRRRPCPPRVALISARSFNDVVDMDVYDIRYGRMLGLLDEFMRHEVEHVLFSGEPARGQCCWLLLKGP